MALAVDAVAIRQRRWWRHTVRGADPLARRVPSPDGRWRGAIVEAVYLASDEATVWAEWYRHLAEAGVPPTQQMPRDLWTWAVDPGLEVADLTTAERLWPGLLAPSAARPRDGLVLCLFREAERVPRTRPLPPPRVVREPPAPPPAMTT